MTVPSPYQTPIPVPQLPTMGIDTPASVDPSPDDAFDGGMSTDALMAYCQSRLDSIDGQIQDSFTSQQSNANNIAAINTFADELKSYNTGVSGASDCATLETKFQTLIQSIQTSDPNCSALPNLLTAYNTMVYSGDGGAQFLHSSSGPDMIDPSQFPPSSNSTKGDNVISVTELQSYTTTLTDAATNLNSSSELQMVQLQSLMSERQTAISLTTNLVQSLGDQESKIADNIGH
jgi:hypothetical protein